MLLIAKFIAKIIALLNSEVSPKQIAAGFAFGVTVGLLPVKGLMPYVLTIISLIINFNLAAMALAALIFKFISFFLDPVANKLGFIALTQPALKGFWTHLYNMPIVPYTRFNNTIVMGSLILGIILLVPMYFLAVLGVENYRARYRDKILKLKLVQILKTTALWRFYENFRDMRGQ